MDIKVLDYRIIIEPEKYKDGGIVYVAHCPTLGISDYGDSVEEVMLSIKDGIQLAVESLVAEKLEVPRDEVQDQIITTARVNFPMGLNMAFG
ncbi:MAG: type II toxin-antitoxin system HicB family antitoxin [Candidatus Amesbacteria bacterium]|nr:type II toxin-antitoxin system HicB family antitoxin [Candidatus Amesbacteria bacterium]